MGCWISEPSCKYEGDTDSRRLQLPDYEIARCHLRQYSLSSASLDQVFRQGYEQLQVKQAALKMGRVIDVRTCRAVHVLAYEG